MQQIKTTTSNYDDGHLDAEPIRVVGLLTPLGNEYPREVALGFVPEGAEARKINAGPMVPGPWGWANLTATVIDNHGGSGKRTRELDVEVAIGEHFTVEGMPGVWMMRQPRNLEGEHPVLEQVAAADVEPETPAPTTRRAGEIREGDQIEVEPGRYATVNHVGDVSVAGVICIDADDVRVNVPPAFPINVLNGAAAVRYSVLRHFTGQRRVVCKTFDDSTDAADRDWMGSDTLAMSGAELAARYVEGALHADGRSLGAYNYGPNVDRRDPAAEAAFASELETLDAGESIRLGDYEVERVA